VAQRSWPVRVAGFGLVPVLGLASPILVLPIIARVASPEEWVAIGIGQGLGGFFAIAVSFGWPLLGPARVLRVRVEERNSIRALSLATRLTVLVALLPGFTAVVFYVTPESTIPLCTLMTVSAALYGLSPGWYFIAMGKPGRLIIAESLPRLLGSLVGGLFALHTEEVIYYPAGILVLPALAILLDTMSYLPTVLSVRPSQIILSFRDQIAAAASSAVAGSYSSLPAVIVSMVAPTRQAALFISAERLYRLALPAIQVTSNVLQGWVISREPQVQRARQMRSLAILGGVGAVGAVVFAFFGQGLGRLLYGEALAPTFGPLIGYGCAFLMVAVSTTLGRHWLVTWGETRLLLVCVVLGALVGLLMLPIMAGRFGATGGAVGLAMAEATVTLAQIYVIARLIKAGRVP